MNSTLDMNVVNEAVLNTGNTGRVACEDAIRGIGEAEGIIQTTVAKLEELFITVTRAMERESTETVGNLTLYCVPYEVKKAVKALFWNVAAGSGLTADTTKARWDRAMQHMGRVKFLESQSPDSIRKRKAAEARKTANEAAKAGAETVAAAAAAEVKNTRKSPEAATVKALVATLRKAVSDRRWHDVAALASKLAEVETAKAE